jgi:hypothetical protein
MSKLAFRAQTVDIAYLPLRQGLLARNALMTAQRDFRLGNNPHIFDRRKTQCSDEIGICDISSARLALSRATRLPLQGTSGQAFQRQP